MSVATYEDDRRQPTHSVEPVVDEMLEILAHADLSHQLVLVAVHPSQLTHVGKDVLQSVRQLKPVTSQPCKNHFDTSDHRLACIRPACL